MRTISHSISALSLSITLPFLRFLIMELFHYVNTPTVEYMLAIFHRTGFGFVFTIFIFGYLFSRTFYYVVIVVAQIYIRAIDCSCIHYLMVINCVPNWCCLWFLFPPFKAYFRRAMAWWTMKISSDFYAFSLTYLKEAKENLCYNKWCETVFDWKSKKRAFHCTQTARLDVLHIRFVVYLVSVCV